MKLKGWKGQQRFRNLVERIEEKKEEIKSTYAYSNYEAAKAFKRDKLLQRWFNQNCKGRPLSEAETILAEGVKRKEISEKQAEIVSITLGFAGRKAFGGISDL